MVKKCICLLILALLLAALLQPVSAAHRALLEPDKDDELPPEPIPTAQPAFDPIWPADTSYEISCLYYYQNGREHSCRYTYRNGLDIAGEGNALAVEDGVIEVVDYLYNSYGNFIVLLHDNGGRSIYAHLARTYVQEGQRVEKGEVIAKIGTTGNSAGVHLHYEYSLADPWLTFYKDKYYDKLYYEQNCLYNNERYNDSKLICQWICDNFVQDEEYFYWNGIQPEMEQTDTAYPTPFWATLLTQEPVTACQWVGGDTACSIEPGTQCLVEAVYQSGWCRVLLRWEEAKMGYLTVYVPSSVFFDPDYTPMKHRALTDMSASADQTRSSTVATLPAAQTFTEVGFHDNLLQVIVETEQDVRHLLWIAHSGDSLVGATIGSDFLATLSDQAEEMLLTQNGDVPIMTEALNTQSTAWAFEYQDNGYYHIADALSGGYLAAQTDGTLRIVSDPAQAGTHWMLCGVDCQQVVLRADDQRVLSVQDDGSLYLADYQALSGQHFCLDAEMIYTLQYDGNSGSAYRSVISGLAYQSSVTVESALPEPIRYTLQLDSGSGEPEAKTYTPVFLGWNSRQNGSGSTYQAGDTLTILGPTKLYAQWEPIVLGALPAPPEREGYTFDGWATEDGLRMTDTSVLLHSMTLHALWVPATQPSLLPVLLGILAGLLLLLIFLVALYRIQKRKNAERQARRAARRRQSSTTGR